MRAGWADVDGRRGEAGDECQQVLFGVVGEVVRAPTVTPGSTVTSASARSV